MAGEDCMRFGYEFEAVDIVDGRSDMIKAFLEYE